MKAQGYTNMNYRKQIAVAKISMQQHYGKFLKRNIKIGKNQVEDAEETFFRMTSFSL